MLKGYSEALATILSLNNYILSHAQKDLKQSTDHCNKTIQINPK
jgi:hypothetical protein